MRISDWSSDVCSSDLQPARRHADDDAGAQAQRSGYGPDGQWPQGAELRDAQERLRRPGRPRPQPRYRTAPDRAHGEVRLVLRWTEDVGRRTDPAQLRRAHAHRAGQRHDDDPPDPLRSEEHTSELQSLMRISYAVFCLKKKKKERK